MQIQIQKQIQSWPKKRLYVRWTQREWPPCSRRGLISRLVHSLARPIASNQSKYTYTDANTNTQINLTKPYSCRLCLIDSTQALVITKPNNSLGPMKLEPRWSLNLKTGCHNQTWVTCSRISQEHSWKRVAFLADQYMFVFRSQILHKLQFILLVVIEGSLVFYPALSGHCWWGSRGIL